MDIYEIYKNENTCRFLLHEPWTLSSKDEEFHKKLTANLLSKDTAISLACEMGNIVIGNISIWYTEMKETVEIGFAFNNKYSGKGYATEAVRSVIEYLFSTVKIHRIQANLDARNLSSAKLCERVGMRKEAHFIQDYWNKGEWTDSFVYGMLVSDFNS
jgi:RimJ/RimL family protein N-acetyltransferase